MEEGKEIRIAAKRPRRYREQETTSQRLDQFKSIIQNNKHKTPIRRHHQSKMETPRSHITYGQRLTSSKSDEILFPRREQCEV